MDEHQNSTFNYREAVLMALNKLISEGNSRVGPFLKDVR